ncbi:MAG TPA: hypothetical protein VEZ11_13780 [Thermoanaerobaculia bacterium]|nr:hypothetical protein [Thermoanaerobaculia bacterium]
MSTLPIKGLTFPEIRVLQEFRRIAATEMPLAAIKAIRHPSGGGEAPAFSLMAKGFLTADDARDKFALTEKAKEFLAIDAKPEVEASGGDAGEA